MIDELSDGWSETPPDGWSEADARSWESGSPEVQVADTYRADYPRARGFVIDAEPVLVPRERICTGGVPWIHGHRYTPDPSRLADGLGLYCVQCGRQATAVSSGGSLADLRAVGRARAHLSGVAKAYCAVPAWQRWLKLPGYRRVRICLEDAYREATALAEDERIAEELRRPLREALASAAATLGDERFS